MQSYVYTFYVFLDICLQVTSFLVYFLNIELNIIVIIYLNIELNKILHIFINTKGVPNS